MEEKQYRYWFFYIKPEYKDNVCIEVDDGLLYAYTDNKDLAKKFEETRDMSKFFKVKRKITRDELNYLADVYNKEYMMMKSFETKTENGDVITCDLVLTKMEFFAIDRAYIEMSISKIWTYTWINPFIFKEKIIDALDNLGYILGYNMIKGNDKKGDIYSIFKPDYISAFIHHFGFLLKNDKG